MPVRLKDYKDADKAKEYRRRMKRRYYHKHNYNALGTKRPFKSMELDFILNNPYESDAVLARNLGRSVASIQIKRWKLRNHYVQLPAHIHETANYPKAS